MKTDLRYLRAMAQETLDAIAEFKRFQRNKERIRKAEGEMHIAYAYAYKSSRADADERNFKMMCSCLGVSFRRTLAIEKSIRRQYLKLPISKPEPEIHDYDAYFKAIALNSATDALRI